MKKSEEQFADTQEKNKPHYGLHPDTDLDETEQKLLETFKRNRNNSLKTLIGIYKGHYLELFLSIFFFAIKHSPAWVLPIVTANIVNIATERGGDAGRKILIQVGIMVVLIAQNVLTNYFYTLFYARAIRNVERDLRCSLVRRLQQLSISYHNEMQSGRLQSKIMRDVEQIETLSKQIFISMLSIVMNIEVSFAVVVTKSMTVFVFFLATIPVAVCIMAAFKSKIKRYNRVFRKDMEETSVHVMEMIEMIPVTRAHALEEKETHKMAHQLYHVASSGLSLDMVQSYFSSISWAAFQIFRYCVSDSPAILPVREKSAWARWSCTRLTLHPSSRRCHPSSRCFQRLQKAWSPSIPSAMSCCVMMWKNIIIRRNSLLYGVRLLLKIPDFNTRVGKRLSFRI